MNGSAQSGKMIGVNLRMCDAYGKVALLALKQYSPREFAEVSTMSAPNCRRHIAKVISGIPDDIVRPLYEMLDTIDGMHSSTAKTARLKGIYYEAYAKVAYHLDLAKQNKETP